MKSLLAALIFLARKLYFVIIDLPAHNSRHNPSILKKVIKRAYTLPQFAKGVCRECRLVYAGCHIEPSASVGSRSIRGANAAFRIGKFSAISEDVEISARGGLCIGDSVVVSSGAKLLTGTHELHTSEWSSRFDGIVIGDYAWICTSAIVLPGVKIGRASVVAAGAVVAKDVPDNVIVAGNPARVISIRRGSNYIYRPSLGVSYINAWLA